MRRALKFAAFVAAVAIAWIVLLPPAGLRQPLAFNHAKHAEMGCAVCHQGVERHARAGLPPAALCLNCHATAPRGTNAGALWDQAARGAGIGWIRVTRVPDHVMFSHRRHVALAKLECVSCHADVPKRSRPPAVAPLRLEMSTCLACHQREGASEDCAACHR